MSRRAPRHRNHLISISRHKKEYSLTASDGALLVTGALRGRKECISSSHLRMSHDQSTLRIDMSLTNTGLLARKKSRKEEEEQRRSKKEEEECNGGMCARDGE